MTGMATATVVFPNADDVLSLDAGVDFGTGTHPALPERHQRRRVL